MSFSKIFLSSIGRKLTMALTGLFLISFLIVHAGLNLCVFANDNGDMFNKAAHFMAANWVPRVLEIGLFAVFILHIAQGYMLFFYNKSKRDIKYSIPYTTGSKWYSRSMAILGTLLLLFLVIHLANFWVPSRFTVLETTIPKNQTTEVANLYGLMQNVFQSWIVVIIYVVGCIALAYHLAHGFVSAFKTLGILHKGILRLLNSMGIAFSLAIGIIFASMPICFYFGIIK
ncbi:MAG: succinate dehydrogenase cytochrome b subunit [Alphaproteobacteria bacterium]|nr:succinate dehydrogenase cytochrome b subunit [Alphaproteobacteria bacterium]